MSPDQLSELYLKYLQREPSGADTRAHLNKSYESFERELSSCDEYLRLKGLITQTGSSENKVAILLSGHIRKNSILEAFSTKFKNLNYDVFVHSWDNYGYKGKETNLEDKVCRDTISREIDKIPNVPYYFHYNNGFNEPLIKPSGIFSGDDISRTIILQRINPCYNKTICQAGFTGPCFENTCNLYYTYSPEFC